MRYFKIFEEGKYIARCASEDVPEHQGRTFIEIPVENMAPSPGYTADENGDFTIPPPPPDLNQIKTEAKSRLLANLNAFYEIEPDGSVRYDANFRELAILYAMQHGLTTAPIPALFAWRSALYAEYATLKAQIDAIADGEGTDEEKVAAIQAVDISVTTFEAKFGKNGSVLPDPGILTEQLMG